MSDRDDGGPAFPSIEEGTEPREVHPGMSLRDYFAGEALGEWVKAHIEGSVDDLNKRQIAVECYGYADAMLAERSKP
jgi:hypothetical protein